MSRRRVVAAGFLTAVLAMAAAGCGADDQPSGTQAGPSTPPSVEPDPVAWLLDEAEAELSTVPGPTWTADRGITVSAACSPTDAHEGWRVTGMVLAPDKQIPDGFESGEAFTLAHADEPRRWTHNEESGLSLVERDDGRVEFELYVAVEDAPDWDAIDQIDVDITFPPERCG